MVRSRDGAEGSRSRQGGMPVVRKACGQSVCPGGSDVGVRRTTSAGRGAGACARRARQAGPAAWMRQNSTTHSAGFVQTPLLLPCVLDFSMMHQCCGRCHASG
ncbi:hypothetical protein AzCIB_3760 [Azoarcus sp. CIB]|nr:hypothetical protein AzCIB_3760 [Azoarcus sp. CIB]